MTFSFAVQKMLKHPLMHKVDSLYAVVLDGEVNLILDKTQTKLKAGDAIINYGSNPARSNHMLGKFFKSSSVVATTRSLSFLVHPQNYL